jgi:hypothetical protein
MLKVDVNSVADVLRELARGHIAAETRHHGFTTWFVRASGFLIEIFDDAGKVDYVARVTDPSGKTATFQQYVNALGYDPIDQLSEADQDALSDRMRGDRWGPLGKKKKR